MQPYPSRSGSPNCASKALASGSRSFRYGPTGRWVERLRVVLADGRVLDVGRGDAIDFDPGSVPRPAVTKNTAGYVLHGLRAGGLPYPSLGFVYLPALALVVATSMLTAPFGARLAHRLPVKRLRMLFALLLYRRNFGGIAQQRGDVRRQC